MIYLTSDTHFYGNEIIIREMRPFKDPGSYAEYQVEVWNNQVAENDDIWHLGDFCNFNKNENDWEKGLELVGLVRANVHLVIGNNEQRIISSQFENDFEKFQIYCIKLGFASVNKDMTLMFKNRKFYLNHFPRNHKEGYINLFGHTHRATGLWKPYGLNVGTDINHFRLYSENDIEMLLQQKELWWDQDIDNNCM